VSLKYIFEDDEYIQSTIPTHFEKKEKSIFKDDISTTFYFINNKEVVSKTLLLEGIKYTKTFNKNRKEIRNWDYSDKKEKFSKILGIDESELYAYEYQAQGELEKRFGFDWSNFNKMLIEKYKVTFYVEFSDCYGKIYGSIIEIEAESITTENVNRLILNLPTPPSGLKWKFEDLRSQAIKLEKI